MSEHVTARRGRPRKDPGGVWAMREAAWNATERDARRAAILAQLREALPEREEGLHGWPEICAFLTRLGLRNRVGAMVTPRAARDWRRRLNMPMLLGRPGQTGRYGVSLPFTTSYALTAWALSLYRSGGPSLPRIVGKSIDSGSGDRPAPNRSLARARVPAGISTAGGGGSARRWESCGSGPIAATPPATVESTDSPSPSDVAMPENDNAAAPAEVVRICSWCGYQWLSPTPARRVRCPRCWIVADPDVPR